MLIRRCAQARGDLGRGDAGDAEGDDAASPLPLVVHFDAGLVGQRSPQEGGQVGDSRIDGLEADVERIVDGDAQPELGGVADLEQLEPSRRWIEPVLPG